MREGYFTIPDEDAPPRYPGWRALWLGVLFTAIFLGVQFCVSGNGAAVTVAVLVSRLLAAGDAAQAVASLEAAMDWLSHSTVPLTLAADAMVLLVMWMIFARRGFFRRVGLNRASLAGIWQSALFGVGLSFFISLVLELLPLPEAWEASYSEVSGLLAVDNLPLYALTVVLVGPMAEEVCFRGLVFGQMRQGLPSWAAALISAALFGAVHLHPLWMAYAALLGLALAWVYARFDSLWACFAMHAAFNAVSLLDYLELRWDDKTYLYICIAFSAAAVAMFLLILLTTRPEEE